MVLLMIGRQYLKFFYGSSFYWVVIHSNFEYNPKMYYEERRVANKDNIR